MAEIVSISIPNDSKGKIEELQKQLSLSGRSELIRAALRSLENEVREHAFLKGTVNAVLVVTHTHDNSLEKIFHKNDELVKTHTHQHVGEKCVEIFMLKGKAEKIRDLYNYISKDKCVQGAKLVIV
jgi:metal-responsive CopG/Arc/MetJ family transcriptional regulator